MPSQFSIVIPYQHSEERLPLLYATIESLIKIDSNFEICIHEVGESRNLSLPKRCKHLFTQYSGVFHRAWVINRCVKKLATNDTLILMDGDLIVSSNWITDLYTCQSPSVGWGKIECLSKEGTQKFLRTGQLDQSAVEKTKSPSKSSAAGAITVINKSLFLSLSGIPEDFYGSWGGEDNAFWSKLTALGYEFKSFNSTVTHLYHSPSTPRVKEVQELALPMFYWSAEQWKEHIKLSEDTFGSKSPTLPVEKSTIYEKSEAKLTIAMLSWIRPDRLIQTLTSLHETLTIPINLVLMVQGSEELSLEYRKVIKDLSKRFYCSDLFFTQGNIGTGPARHHLQHRALTRFHSPYLNFGDDDTTYTKGSIEAAIDLLEKDYSIGVVSIRYKPNVYRLNSQFIPRTLGPEKASNSIEYVDSAGSASAIIRRDVFDLCSVDPEYKLGQWDLDFFLQARSVGWKIVNYQAFSGMRAINNFGGSPEYRRGRMDRAKINKSIQLFKQKWGLLKAV